MCASERDWSDNNDHLSETERLGADAAAFIRGSDDGGGRGYAMVSADREGRVGLSFGRYWEYGGKTTWCCPPEVYTEAWKVLRSFQVALNVPANAVELA